MKITLEYSTIVTYRLHIQRCFWDEPSRRRKWDCPSEITPDHMNRVCGKLEESLLSHNNLETVGHNVAW